MDKITVYLPPVMHQTLRALSRGTGRTQADLLREALQRYLDLQPRPIPQSIGAGADPDLHGADSEDWLRDNWRPD